MICVEIAGLFFVNEQKNWFLGRSLPGQKMHFSPVEPLLLAALNFLLNESTMGNTKNVYLEAEYEKKLTLHIYINMYIYSFTIQGLS